MRDKVAGPSFSAVSRIERLHCFYAVKEESGQAFPRAKNITWRGKVGLLTPALGTTILTWAHLLWVRSHHQSLVWRQFRGFIFVETVLNVMFSFLRWIEICRFPNRVFTFFFLLPRLKNLNYIYQFIHSILIYELVNVKYVNILVDFTFLYKYFPH